MGRTRTTIRWADHAPALVLVALPLVLLLANGSWIWDNPDFNDSSVYIGFFRHYLEFKLPFAANYKASRLPWVLPGVLAYRLLPAVAAHHVLFLTFLSGETLIVFALTRRRFGAQAAFITAAAVATSTFSHRTPSYHNQAATTYFLAALLLLERPARWTHTRRALCAGAALALAATTDTIVLALGPAFALHALATMPAPRRARRIAGTALLVVAGGACAFLALGLVNRALGGKFLFFVEQVRYSMAIARAGTLSTVALPQFITEIDHRPLDAMPFVVTVCSIALLVARALRWRWDWAALETLAFVVSMAAAVAMELRGMGLLELHVLLHPFFAPMYLAIAALVGSTWRGAPAIAARLSPRFLVAVAACFLAPLALFGAAISRLLIQVGESRPSVASGVPILFALFALAIVAGFVLRRRSPMDVIAIAACLGLMNAFCTEDSQPAHVYQAGATCNFRGDVFRSMIDGDDVIGTFDPKNAARWKSQGGWFGEPLFDGKGWCSILPMQADSNAVLLTHYFYTTAELAQGFPDPPPLGKITVAGNSPGDIADLTGDVQSGLPPGFTLKTTLDWKRVYSTLTLYLRGFDVVPPPRAADARLVP